MRHRNFAEQLGELDRVQVRKNELIDLTHRPYLILFSMLLTTLASHFLLGPGRWLQSPFLGLQEFHANALKNSEMETLNKVQSSIEKTMQEVLDIANKNPIRKILINTQVKNPLEWFDHGAALLDNIAIPSTDIEKRKDEYVHIILAMARLVVEKENDEYYFADEAWKGNVFSTAKGRAKEEKIDELRKKSFTDLSKLIKTNFQRINSKALQYKNEMDRFIQKIEHSSYVQALINANYQFMLGFVAAVFLAHILLIEPIANRFYRKLCSTNSNALECKSNDVENQITLVFNETKRLRKTVRRHTYGMAFFTVLALSLSIYYQLKKKEDSPALYFFILSNFANICVDLFHAGIEKYQKSCFEDEMKKINMNFNKAVFCTEYKWQSLMGDSISSSLLLFSPNKLNNLSGRAIAQAVRLVLKEYDVQIISFKNKSLTVNPESLSNNKIDSINRGIKDKLAELRFLQDSKTDRVSAINDHYFFSTLPPSTTVKRKKAVKKIEPAPDLEQKDQKVKKARVVITWPGIGTYDSEDPACEIKKMSGLENHYVKFSVPIESFAGHMELYHTGRGKVEEANLAEAAQNKQGLQRRVSEEIDETTGERVVMTWRCKYKGSKGKGNLRTWGLEPMTVQDGELVRVQALDVKRNPCDAHLVDFRGVDFYSHETLDRQPTYLHRRQ